MANGYGKETPANKIATATATLGLAMRLNGEVSSKRITTELFSRGVKIITQLDGRGLYLPPFPEGTQEDLEHGIFNIVQIALGASALTVDEALDEVYGPADKDTDVSTVGLRVMVNQLRNAFAHNPWRPKWVVFPKYRQRYPIVLYDGTTFTFDATQLDGDGVKTEQVGGLEFWTSVLKHCELMVSK